MGIRQNLALMLAPDLSKVLDHVETALAELGVANDLTPAPVANAIEELTQAAWLLRGGPPPTHR